MSNYDKRRSFKLYTDGRDYVLSSQFIENEKLLLTVIDQQLYIHKISNDEWVQIQNKSKSRYIMLVESYGCLGLLTIEDAKKEYFLVFIKDAASVNSIGKFEILRIADAFIVNINCDLNPDEIMQSNVLLNNNNSFFFDLRKFLSSGYFYFKYTSDLNCTFDITLNAQLRHLNAQTESKFLWNANLHAPFRRLCVNTNHWLLKIICGCVEIRKVIVGSDTYKACIISRLSAERAGTRFNCRGANDYGHCANYVETEQIVFSDTEENCFLQIRGSIPLFWEQSGIQVGNHRVKISRSIESSYTAFERHFKALLKQFDKQCLILNLLSAKGDEILLTKLYENLYKNSSDSIKDSLQFIHFDYHNEMKMNKQALLDHLWPRLQNWIKANLNLITFHTDIESQQVINEQKSIIRTNCLDCLDRTNSVQLFIGLELLRVQLNYFKQLQNNEKILQKFREVFRQMWIINGDNLSKMYAGTGAIQGKSVTQDLQRSLTRAIQNNFLDNTKQYLIDMLLYGVLPSSSNMRNDLVERSRIMLTHHCLTLPSYILKHMISNYTDYTEKLTCHVAIGTWNINGGLGEANMKSLKLADWLIDGPFNARRDPVNGYLDPQFKRNLSSYSCEFIDIFAIGFEEIVDLNASNIVNASDENSHIWYKKIFEFLCKNGDYMPITYEPLQLVGVCLFVFVHKRHSGFIRDVAVSKIKTGLGGTAGNKGGVAMRFTYYNSSMCFICSHFSAHQNQVKQRNDDFKQIIENSDFPQSRDIKSHDYILWFGDLNYRIDMPNDYVRKIIKECDWDTLLQAEQLTLQKKEGFVFNDFNEGPLCFPPTYKYNLMEDTYDRSEKNRVPAWTDRVLWSRRRVTKAEREDRSFNTGKCLYYGRADIRYSDHRPVLALLELEVNKVVPMKLYKAFENVLNTKGPFQGTIIVSVNDGQTKITEKLKDAIVKLIGEFNKFPAYREYNNCLYISYYMFQKAFECCKKFNNFHFEEWNCILNVRMENDDFTKLAQEELKHLIETHVWLNQHQMSEVQVANLLGDDLFDEQSFIQVPSQIHSNLSISHNLSQLTHIPSTTDLLSEHHHLANNPIRKSFSNSNMDIVENMGGLSLGSGGGGIPSSSSTNSHLFDLPNDDFESITTAKIEPLRSLPVPKRPPPPPPSNQQQSQLLFDVPLISVQQPNSYFDPLERTPSPVPTATANLSMTSNNNFIAHFSQSAPNVPQQHIIDQPLIPIPPPRTVPPLPSKPTTKQPPPAFNKDLFMLGDPGTPPPPPPIPPKQQQQAIRPMTLNFANTTTTTTSNNTDFDLLGAPGTPPTPPPVVKFT